MPSTRRSIVLVHSMWGVAGFALGASVALLWVQKLKPEWVEATGTWFGAIATVLAVLWAVRTFRSDQAERERVRIEEKAREQQASLSAAADVKAEAGRVVIGLRGGGGYGNSGQKKMNSVHLDIFNGASKFIEQLQVQAHAPLHLKQDPGLPVRIAPGENWTELLVIEELDVRDEDLSGKALTGMQAELEFRLDGRTWLRTSDGTEPRLLED